MPDACVMHRHASGTSGTSGTSYGPPAVPLPVSLALTGARETDVYVGPAAAAALQRPPCTKPCAVVRDVTVTMGRHAPSRAVSESVTERARVSRRPMDAQRRAAQSAVGQTTRPVTRFLLWTSRSKTSLRRQNARDGVFQTDDDILAEEGLLPYGR